MAAGYEGGLGFGQDAVSHCIIVRLIRNMILSYQAPKLCHMLYDEYNNGQSLSPATASAFAT